MTVGFVMTTEEVELHELALEINETLKSAELKFKKCFDDVSLIGELLIIAKDKVKRTGNSWIDWIEGNLDINRQQVTRYMRVHRKKYELLEMDSGVSISNFSIDGAMKFLSDKAKEDKENERIDGLRKQIPEVPNWNGRFEPSGIFKADSSDLDFINSLPENSIDLVITDPPWDPESLIHYESAARIAARALRPGRTMGIYCGKMYLPEILSVVTDYLDYVWIVGDYQPNNRMKIRKYRILEKWRPIVLFKKPGDYEINHDIKDFYETQEKEKEHHEWQQGELLSDILIKAYTEKDELVLDPYSGGGTTASVASRLNRNYLAFDNDEDAVRAGIARLNNV